MRRLSRLDRRHLAAGAFLAFCLLPAAALAQLTNDEIPRIRTVPLRDEIEGEMQGSRFRLGPVRLLPQVTLAGPTYDSNALGASGDQPKFSDWYGTLTAGLNLLMPLGKKVYLRGTVFPQYIWYDRLSDRRRFGGEYGGNVYAFFNRLSFDGGYRHSLTLGYPNSEILTQVLEDSDRAVVRVEVDLTGHISLWAGAEYQQLEYRPAGDITTETDALVAALNRKEEAVRGGLRYRITSSFDVGVGAEGTRTEFPLQPTQADNSSTAYLARVHYDRPRVFVNFSGGYRIGRAINGSAFPEYSGFTGSGFLSYELLSHLSLGVYGKRAIAYGVFQENPYYTETLGGGSLTLQVGRRITVNGFGERGTNHYPVAVDSEVGRVRRSDKVTTYGGGLGFLIFRSVSLSAAVSNSDYNSNIPSFDRSVLRFTSGLIITFAP